MLNAARLNIVWSQLDVTTPEIHEAHLNTICHERVTPLVSSHNFGQGMTADIAVLGDSNFSLPNLVGIFSFCSVSMSFFDKEKLPLLKSGDMSSLQSRLW